MEKFSLIFLLSTFCAFGQNISGVIKYKETLNLGDPVERHWSLYFDDNQSIYLETNSFETNSLTPDFKEKSEKTSNKSDELVINVDIDEFYVASSKTQSLKSQQIIAAEPYKVVEILPKIEWKLTEEKKKIKNFNCQKAVGYFRGRSYIVWFTEDIPTRFGPWKLSGLPGAILEFQDKTGQIKSIALKVELTSDLNIENIINSKAFIGKSLSIEAYVEKKQDENVLMLKYAMAKLGREANIQNVAPYEREGFELKYEWE
ncbi:GLPGLI family protein [Subsaximicrobium wynnwilliamsii]|uniref:GLPGLI family protein n=1 Tax=Subsaximicrobium wynnwilliamsii TaxID=291179 RepID=A0A5C6ZED6_9FLAO|nr:GLPGLI family protein [Subsaximicrobium wynnwilliamsii]TXD82525.1 GLPGLI family protein [Subsaximicrobium wynnwilliamsii]TXD88168.1 GLPGLI family protein [Subsaximicrobium wynnwilliamsii]TXE02183.1 GLPGLI family protein [Subsaximicrobium wynnwilliamsii]